MHDLIRVNGEAKEGKLCDFRSVELALIRIGKRQSLSSNPGTSQKLLERVRCLFGVIYAARGLFRANYHFQAINRLKKWIAKEAIFDEEGEEDSHSFVDESQRLQRRPAMREKSPRIEDQPCRPAPKNASQLMPVMHTTKAFGEESEEQQQDLRCSPSRSICQTIAAFSQEADETLLSPSPLTGTSAPIPNPPPPSPAPNMPPQQKYVCSTCGYIPHGEERWKASNLARHKRTQHSTVNGKKSWGCAYPGCKSAFSRSDNLAMHVREKGHWVRMGEADERERKRKRV